MKTSCFSAILVLPIFFLAPFSYAETASKLTDNEVKTVKSPKNRVALLELYTSEGCSSCPPADRFLSNLKQAGVSSKQLIPLAFHVTYWDYIGWKDRFADKKYDLRQRDQANKKRKKTIYTPQFMLIGNDYRRYSTFSEDINKLVAEDASIDMELSSQRIIDDKKDQILVKIRSDITDSEVDDVGFYIAVVENNLTSDVRDGENEGEKLHHDFVVRKLAGPFFHSKPDLEFEQKHTITLHPEWKRQDLSVVAFAENPHTGEVLQAVRLKY